MQIKSKLYNELEDDKCCKKKREGGKKGLGGLGCWFWEAVRGHLQGEVRWSMWVLLRRWNLSKQLKDVS